MAGSFFVYCGPTFGKLLGPDRGYEIRAGRSAGPPNAKSLDAGRECTLRDPPGQPHGRAGTERGVPPDVESGLPRHYSASAPREHDPPPRRRLVDDDDQIRKRRARAAGRRRGRRLRDARRGAGARASTRARSTRSTSRRRIRAWASASGCSRPAAISSTRGRCAASSSGRWPTTRLPPTSTGGVAAAPWASASSASDRASSRRSPTPGTDRGLTGAGTIPSLKLRLGFG